MRGVDAFLTSALGAIASRGTRYDIIHFHALGPAVFTWLPRITSPARVVVTCQGLDWQRAKWGGFSSRVILAGEKAAVRFAHEIVVVSEALQSYFLRTYDRQTVYIPNAPASYAESDPNFSYGTSLGLEQGRYILFLGRLVPEKRPDLLLEAFSALKPAGWKLVLAGGISDTRAYVAQLLDKVAKNPDIVFAGELWGARLAEIVRGAGLFVQPSELEGLPLSMLEAMREGIPAIWRSTDGGMTWTGVTNLSANPDPEIGILAIAFDPKVSGRIYISAYGDGIYQSTDAGNTWTKMAGSPTKAMKLAIASDSTLYVTSANAPGVSKYTNGVWQDITPNGQAKRVFNGLSLYPDNPNEVLVILGEISSAKIYHSKNKGASWVEKRTTLNKRVPWWPDRYFSDHPSAIQLDPQVPNRAWLTDWFGVWRTDNINANPALWTNYVKGHEQTVIFTLVSPPQGALLLSGIADVEGFYHHRLDSYPHRRFGYEKPSYDLLDQPWFQDSYSIAYCAAKLQHLVRVGGKRWKSTYNGATSTDSGLTWKRFPNFPANTIPQRIAVSATNPNKFVVTVSEGQPLQTSDGGVSWQQVSGLPNGVKGPWKWSQPLAADGVNGNKFYYYSDGKVYRSDNGGLSFHPVNTSLPKKDWYSIKTMPGIEGEVWLSLDEQGLYRSTDGSNTFSKIYQVEKAHLFSFGKSSEKIHHSVLYLYGKIANQGAGIFLSLNGGQTWINIDEKNNHVGSVPTVIEASKQQFGLVFIGTNGRGIYYRSIAKDPKILID